MAVVATVVAHQSTSTTSPAPSDGNGFVKPVEGRLSSGFGARAGGTHYGIDIAAPTGTPIRAVAGGTVIEAEPARGYGLWMRLRHEDGTVTVYGHMHTMDRARGARVAAGEQIATVGSRGQSTGPHLHFEVWPGGDRQARVDPKPWLARHGIHY
ncbi:murein hydrolase activator EnvC family protein [Kibdelosporangium phytohabitans]|uniref:murein hydrolase activator EnvC family protein n=1 Tax=Kibdelosporangium phytohabitans TaxID=860235 RepID=UPI0019F7E82C|nr:M23 family metallopeptidase [Kibdelosporangium phytohabitans]MBE1466218.1 murein DD-endopeptidase MepM/ murein hydrolase activator NlpD [Kibdelosporangium phytohabitans]